MTTLATAVLGSDEDDDDYVPEEDIAAQKAAAAAANRAAKQEGADLLFTGRTGGGTAGSRRAAAKGKGAPAGTDAEAQLVGKAATRKRRMDAMWAELNGGTAPSGAQAQAGAAGGASATSSSSAAAAAAAAAAGGGGGGGRGVGNGAFGGCFGDGKALDALLARLAAVSMKQLPRFKAQELCNLLWAFATLR